MQCRALDGESGRIDWGDLLDEAWGTEEALTQPIPDTWPSCEVQETNNTLSDSTNLVPHQPTDTTASAGRNTKVSSEPSLLQFFPNLSKSSKPGTKSNTRLGEQALGPFRDVSGRRQKKKSISQASRAKLNSSGSVKKHSTAATHTRREALRQLCLDLGQKSFGHVTCRVCGMVYSLGHTRDEEDHCKFHRRYLAGVAFHGWKQERVVSVFFDGRILVVFPDDRRRHLRKVQELCSVVDSELGYAAGVSPWRATTKMFIYVSTAKKVMGCIFAERISEGYPVLGSNTTDSIENLDPSMTSPTMMSSSVTSLMLPAATENHFDSQSAWYCSSTPKPAVVGVNRVWVCPQHRRKGVASRILDTIRFNFIPGSVIARDEIAFSDPTPSGKSFAATYCGTENFLVYHWST